MDRDAQDKRERRDVDTLGSLLGRPASFIPPVLHGYPAGSYPVVKAYVPLDFRRARIVFPQPN
jgi:hypothetical protein